MLTRENKIMISVVIGTFAVIVFVSLYGFTIGGEYLSVKYIAYCFLTSFFMTSLAFAFIFKKEHFKKFFAKKPYVILCLILVAVQLFLYQPLNLLSSSDSGEEYEVEITYCSNVKASSTVYFIDKNGVERSKDVSFKYIVGSDDELWPNEGGRMIVREITGGFNCKYFEIVKITYDPYVPEQ